MPAFDQSPVKSSTLASKGWIAAAFALLVANIGLLVIGAYSPSVISRIDSSAIKTEIGFARVVAVPFESYFFELPSDGVSNRSKLRLFEEGKELGEPHAPHADVRERGAGRYSHWYRQIWFSSSDNTDPRINGRRYEIASPSQVKTSLVIAIICFDVLALALFRRRLQQRYSQEYPAATVLSQSLSNWLLGVLAGSTVAIALGVAIASHLEYRTNDDVNMRFIAERIISDSSTSAYLFYQNILVGLALKALYNLAPHWPWYDINILGGAVFGAFLCIFGTLRLCRFWAERFVACAAAIFMIVPMFQAVQFSASAMLLAAGAVIVFCVILFDDVGKVLTRWLVGAAFIAFVWGGLIRFEAAMLVVLTAAPLAAFGWRRLGRRHIGVLVACAASVFLCLGAAAYNAHYYSSSPGWDAFQQRVVATARATDWLPLDSSSGQQVDAALKAAGWTPNDYELLSGWMASNKELFSEERMQRFAALAPRMSVLRVLRGIFLEFANLPTEVWLLACIPFVTALAIGTFQGFVVAGASLIWLVTMTVVTALVFKVSFGHIIWPLFASTLLVANAVILAMPRRITHAAFARTEQAIVRIAAVAGLLWLSSWQVARVAAVGLADEQFRTGPVARDLAVWPLKQNDLVVVWNNNFPFELWPRPFGKIEPTARQFLHTTGTVYSPLAEGLYRKWGTSDVAWAMCHVPGVLRVEDKRRDYASAHERQLATYMKQHHGEAVRADEVFAGETLTLYVCKPVR
jgi:hypothetical protein